MRNMPNHASLKFAGLPLKTCILLALAMITAAALTVVATPKLTAMTNSPQLEATVPIAFAGWTAMPRSAAQVSVSQGVQTEFENPYDQTVLRTYVNAKGDELMLALAWGARQRQDVKVHQPEVCYPAQGYSVLEVGPGRPISLTGRTEQIPTVSLLARVLGNSSTFEAVRYWIRIGTIYEGDGLKARWYILKEGIHGRVPDGILVRVSQRIRSVDQVPRAQALMEGFLSDLTAALPPSTLAMLVK